MAFWWVFQNSTYNEEKAGSFLWAPKKGKNKIPFHWKNMEYLQEGDIVFSSYRQRIVAVSTVISKAYTFMKPFTTNSEKPWEYDGNKVDLNFHELDFFHNPSNNPKTTIKINQRTDQIKA